MTYKVRKNKILDLQKFIYYILYNTLNLIVTFNLLVTFNLSYNYFTNLYAVRCAFRNELYITCSYYKDIFM